MYVHYCITDHASIARGCCGPKRVDVIHVKLAWGSLYDKPRLVGWYDRTGAVKFRDVKGASLSAWGCACYLFVRVFSDIVKFQMQHESKGEEVEKYPKRSSAMRCELEYQMV